MALAHQFEFANQSISEVENGRENCLVNLHSTHQLAHLFASHEDLLLFQRRPKEDGPRFRELEARGGQHAVSRSRNLGHFWASFVYHGKINVPAISIQDSNPDQVKSIFLPDARAPCVNFSTPRTKKCGQQAGGGVRVN